MLGRIDRMLTGLKSSVSPSRRPGADTGKIRTTPLWLCAACALLCACGQKGPLYLPAAPAASTHAPAAAGVPAAAASAASQ
ncbi:MAG: lipoprotein [Leptothrix sp. (in: b-proteobacteria)]